VSGAGIEPSRMALLQESAAQADAEFGRR